MNIGVNTFGLGRQLTEDFTGTLCRLKSAGVTSVEPCILYAKSFSLAGKTMKKGFQRMIGAAVFCDDEIPEKLATVREKGFVCNSVHIMGFNLFHGSLIRILPELKALAQEQQIRFFVCSFSISKISKARKWIAEVQKVCAELETVGAKLLLHNHNMELLEDHGDTVMRFMLEQVPQLGLELDLGWAHYAGSDCVALMKQYQERIHLLHFKDYIGAASGKKPEFVAIGNGCIPLESIMENTSVLGSMDPWGFIIDQDSSLTDIMDDVAAGLCNIKRAEKGRIDHA